MQGHVNFSASLDRPTLDLYLVVERVNPCTELLDDATIDLNQAVDNQPFACAAGRHTSLGKKLLKADLHQQKGRRTSRRTAVYPMSQLWQRGLNRGFSLAEAGDTVTFLPLTSVFKDLDALVTLEDVTLGPKGA